MKITRQLVMSLLKELGQYQYVEQGWSLDAKDTKEYSVLKKFLEELPDEVYANEHKTSKTER